MKIAVYSHYFVPEIGAPSARIYDLAREWIAHGNDVQVVTCLPNHPTGVIYPGYSKRLYQREEIAGIDVHRTWSYVTANKGFLKKTIGHISFHPSSIISSVRRGRADVYIGTSPTFFAAMAAARVAALRRRPFVMEVRDLWPAVFVELGVLKNKLLIGALEKLELSLYRRAARVVTVTDAFRQNLIDRGIPAEKVKTIPNGADMEFWTGTEDDHGLRASLGLQGKTVALYIGAHGISQALRALLAAAKRLQGRGDIVFLFVGEGAEKELLLETARREALANVRFLDSVGKEAVRDYYAMADLALVPLRNIPLFDTFIPSKMFEIMAMATPIVASLRGEAAGILERSGGALVVGPEDDAAIAEAVVALADDPERRRSMGQDARRFVRDHYSRQALAARYLDVLEEAVNVGRGA